jgi:hypothetical protein
LLEKGKPRIADFGLAQLLWLPSGQPVAERNARYSAPELMAKKISRSCDQYSLALLYHELVTGVLPSRDPRGRGNPYLDRLPEADRAHIRRALERNPSRRFPSNSKLFQALKSVQYTGQGVSSPPLEKHLAELAPTVADFTLPPEEEQAKSAVLLRKFSVPMTLESAMVCLRAICNQFQGVVFRDDGQIFSFHVNKPTRSWKSWLGRPPALEVQFYLAQEGPMTIEATVQFKPLRCSEEEGVALLEDLGPRLLISVRAQMHDNSERRSQDRLRWDQPMMVSPILEDGRVGEPITCRGKDISLTGIGFYLPRPMPTLQVNIQLPTPFQDGLISVPATLVRSKRCEDGSFEIGALFRLALGAPSDPGTPE